MEQQNQNKSKEDGLTPEEQKARQEVEDALRPAIDSTLGKIFSILDWCWEATIVMAIAQQVLLYCCDYYVSPWIVTVFLWAPFGLVIAITALLLGFFYLISLFASWRQFLLRLSSYFMIGFDKRSGKDSSK